MGDGDDDNGPPAPGPFVLPGNYQVKLEADGKTFTQTVTVQMDPRSVATPAELTQQFPWAQRVYSSLTEADAAAAAKATNKKRAAEIQTLAQSLNGILNAIESADRTPPAQVLSAYHDTIQKLAPLLKP